MQYYLLNTSAAHLQTSLKSVTISIATFISLAISASSASFLLLSYCEGSRNSKNCCLNAFTDINEEVHSPRVAILKEPAEMLQTLFVIGQWKNQQRLANRGARSNVLLRKHYGLVVCFQYSCGGDTEGGSAV